MWRNLGFTVESGTYGLDSIFVRVTRASSALSLVCCIVGLLAIPRPAGGSRKQIP